MAISQSQKVDFLYKKLGFTKTKTGLSVDGTLSGTKKAGFGEVFASPLVIADGSVWNQSELIPTTPPGSTTSIVRVYGVASALRMTVDPTTAGRRSYIAYETFNDTTSTRLTNWIDTQFGNDYVVKVYAGDPNSGGTLLPAGGSTGSDSWFFDYSAGILQFHDTTIHSSIDANGTNVYIVGYRYLGQTGVISIGDDTNFGDLTVNNNFRVVGLSTFVGAVNLSDNLSVAGITTLAGLSTVTGHTLFTKQLDVSGISTFGGALDVNSTSNFGDDVTFQTANTKNIVLDKSDNTLKFGDNVFAKFGDSGDLSIYHHTTDGSIINHFGNNHLVLRSGNRIDLRSANDDTYFARFVEDGAAELYHDGGIRFETTGIGVSVLAGTGNTATIAGPQFLILDPDGVGVNTGVVRIKGDLIVDGEQTIVRSTELEIADFIVGIATTATTDALADGAGFKIGPNNTLLYEYNSGINPSLKSSESLNVANGRAYQIGEVERLSASTLNVTRLLKGYSYSAAPYGGIETITVTVADKISGQHRYYGQGSSLGYVFDEQQSPFITLTPGRTYRFDQSHSSNSNHQIKFYLEADKTTLYEGGVTYNGTAGNFGAYTQIVVSDETPTILHYMCVNHGYMGNSAQVNSNVVNTNYDAILRGGLTVSGISTFNGLVDVNAELNTTGGRIVGAATNNVIPFLYSNYSDLPSAITYHGAFAHVHATGKGYFGHANAWYELVNRNLDGTVGTGTDSYNVGIITATEADINGDLDVDGQTELDDVNVSGIATFKDDVEFHGSTGITSVSFDKSDNSLKFVDDAKLKIGNSGDLELYYSPSGVPGSYFNTGSASGNLTIKNQDAGQYVYIHGDHVHLRSTTNNEAYLQAQRNGAVSLYYDQSNHSTAKFATTGYGATVFGTIQAQKLNITGIATVAGDVDFNGNLDVDGLTNLDDVIISGVTTTSNHILPDTNGTSVDLGSSSKYFRTLYVSNLATAPGGPGIIGQDLTIRNINATGIVTVAGSTDLNGDLDVDGTTELDGLNVDGGTTLDATTIDGLLDINAGGQANTFKVEDLTSGRIVLAGTGGEIEDSANLTFNGSTLEVTGKVGINSGTPNKQLDVIGDAGMLVASTTNGGISSTSGISIFLSDNRYNPSMGADYDLDQIGEINYQHRDVLTPEQDYSDVFAFKSNQNDLAVSVEGTLLVGVTTSNNGGKVGIGTSIPAAKLDVVGHTELDDVNVSGVITATSYVGGLPIANGANNRVITASSASAIQAESGLTYDGTYLNHIGSGFKQLKIDTSTSNSASLLLKNQQGNFTVNTINNSGNRNFTIYDGTAGETRFSINQNGTVGISEDLDVDGNLTVGVGGTTITTVVGAAASVGIGDASPSYMLDVAGAINSQTDVKVNGVSVTEQALNDAVAMAIALG